MNTTTKPTSPPAHLPSQAKHAAALSLLPKEGRHSSEPAAPTTTPSFVPVLPRVCGRPHTLWSIREGLSGGGYSSWLNPDTDKFVESPEAGLRKFAKANRIGKKWWQW